MATPDPRDPFDDVPGDPLGEPLGDPLADGVEETPIELEWVEGLPSETKASRSRHYDQIVASLSQRPGQWAKVGAGLKGGDVSNLRLGLSARGCEVTSRRGDVYAAYTGKMRKRG